MPANDEVAEVSAEKKEEDSERDEEVDIAKATEIVRNFMRDNFGSLISLQFRIDSIEKNGSQTRYVIVCSIVPDIGEERKYYLIRVNVASGKLVPPLGQGKKTPEGKLELENLDVDPKWTD